MYAEAAIACMQCWEERLRARATSPLRQLHTARIWAIIELQRNKTP